MKNLFALICCLFLISGLNAYAQPGTSDFETYGEQPVEKKKKKKTKKVKEKKEKEDKPKKEKDPSKKSNKDKPKGILGKNKDNNRKKSNASGDSDVISLDIDDLFESNLDTVLVLDKRKIISFQDQQKIEYFYGQALQKVSNKNHEGALDFLNKSLKIDPKSKEVLQLRGNVYSEMNKFGKAKKDLKKVQALYPDDPTVNYNLAAVYSKLGKLKSAIEYFTNAIDNDPDYVLAFQGRAAALSLEKQFAAAINDYNQVLDKNSFFTPAYKGRGIAKSLTGRFDEAVVDFTQAINLVPTDGFAFYYRGLAYKQMSENQKACADFNKAYQFGIYESRDEMRSTCGFSKYYDVQEYMGN